MKDPAPGQLDVDAFGAGFVTAQFEPDQSHIGAWVATQADYRIGVVPEPATWLLVASGVLFPAGLRWWRQRSM